MTGVGCLRHHWSLGVVLIKGSDSCLLPDRRILLKTCENGKQGDAICGFEDGCTPPILALGRKVSSGCNGSRYDEGECVDELRIVESASAWRTRGNDGREKRVGK